MKKIVLGSASPRRFELLKSLGYEFEVCAADIEENYPSNISVYKVAEYIAHEKFNHLISKIDENALLICADTIVLIKDEILGKPIDTIEATSMLKKLSGKHHEVITGVCIGNSKRNILFSCISKVFFSKIAENEINHYVQNYNPLDKAGAYGIQDWIGLTFIDRIDGSYTNIVGLPTNEVYKTIESFNSDKLT